MPTNLPICCTKTGPFKIKAGLLWCTDHMQIIKRAPCPTRRSRYTPTTPHHVSGATQKFYFSETLLPWCINPYCSDGTKPDTHTTSGKFYKMTQARVLTMDYKLYSRKCSARIQQPIKTYMSNYSPVVNDSRWRWFVMGRRQFLMTESDTDVWLLACGRVILKEGRKMEEGD